MKQRVILARTFLHKPKILFLDEPTSALDPGSAKDIQDIIRELNAEGTTIFLTTHKMEDELTTLEKIVIGISIPLAIIFHILIFMSGYQLWLAK